LTAASARCDAPILLVGASPGSCSAGIPTSKEAGAVSGLNFRTNAWMGPFGSYQRVSVTPLPRLQVLSSLIAAALGCGGCARSHPMLDATVARAIARGLRAVSPASFI
jgi:hypothetical protein